MSIPKQLKLFFKIHYENPGKKTLIAKQREGLWILELHVAHKTVSIYELETKRGEIRKFKQLNAIVKLLLNYGVSEFTVEIR